MRNVVRVSFAAAATVLALMSGIAQAAPFINPFAHYSVVIDSGNTMMTSVGAFNGNEATLGGLYVSNPFSDTPLTVEASGLVTFVADPGYAFTSMFMTRYPFYWANRAFGYHYYSASWSVTGAGAAGDSYSFFSSGDPLNCGMRCDNIVQTGTTGTFAHMDFFGGSGGGSTFRGSDFMTTNGITFSNASSFTILMNARGTAAGEFGWALSVGAETMLAPPPAPGGEGVPAPGAMAIFALGLCGLGLTRRTLVPA